VKGAKAAASYTAATIWPYKFITHLLKSLVGSGDLNLQTHTPVTEVTSHPDGGFIVVTPRETVRAGQVVHANNAYVGRLLPEYSSSIVPCKGICCHITVPEGKTAPLLSNSYIERDADKTLSYLIPRLDGSIVVGGAQSLFKPHLDQWYNNVDDSILIQSAKNFYDGYMQRTFRGWEDSEAKVSQIWTGVMGYSFDTTCHIGQVPDRPGQLIIAGFNGHGMPVIFLGAKGLAKMINEGVPFEETGLPRLFETSKERIALAQTSKEEHGDIIGDGSLTGPGSD
jgi:glycine/D-amino acid oxidase-like deaminating enzyme